MRNYPLQFQWIPLQDAGAILLEAQKQLDIPDDSALERFVQSSAEFTIGQALQNIWIDQYHPRMIKSSKQIFSGHQIDCGLAPDGSIHLRQNRRGNLHQFYAPHVKGGQQSGNIAHHAPTQRDDDCFSIRSQASQFLGQNFDRRQAFGGFAIRHGYHLGIEATAFQRINQFWAPALSYRGYRDHKNTAGMWQKIAEHRPSAGEHPVFDPSLVRPRLHMNGDLRHAESMIADAANCLVSATKWYHFPSMKGLPAETDFVVIGAGVAGLRAAIELASAGRVLVLAKRASGAQSDPAHPSLAAVLSDEDEIMLHLQDTIEAGDGLCNPTAVKILIDEGAERIAELISWGTHGRETTKLVFGPESGHSRGRLLHAQGESTGTEILRILYAKAHSLKNISVAESIFTTSLSAHDGRITSVSLLDEKGTPHQIACSAVLLATGAMGQVYRSTTNLEAATADGVALACRTGAEVSDMEFVQFHPTVLYLKKAPRFLLAESLRREGAHLRNIELDRFMGKYHPMGELAPPDLVARAIVHEMEVSRAKEPIVYLDLTHLSPAKVQKRFPRIYATFMQHNMDITEDLIPVRPAAHFSIGGVRTDLDGKTTLGGLYAAGEVAACGVHGANRLPSNSLLESLVYGARAGRAMREAQRKTPKTDSHSKSVYANGPVDAGAEELISQIQTVMWNEVGVVRTRAGMQKAIKTLEEITPRLENPRTRRAHEAANLHLAGLLIARSALAREESRGAHYRIDYPDHDDKKFLKHSVVRGDKVAFL